MTLSKSNASIVMTSFCSRRQRSSIYLKGSDTLQSA